MLLLFNCMVCKISGMVLQIYEQTFIKKFYINSILLAKFRLEILSAHFLHIAKSCLNFYCIISNWALKTFIGERFGIITFINLKSSPKLGVGHI